MATVVYADLSGFTTISEKLDPEEVTTLINRCFEALEAAVIGHGGTVNKFIGDCVLALFGIDEPPQDAARRAVAAAVEMHRAIAEINRQGGVPGRLEIHIGVATGPVITGEVGGTRYREFTATGETVTIAERLEDASTAGQILVSSATREFTRDTYEYRAAEPLTVHENVEPLPIYEWFGIRQRREHVRRGSERRRASVMFAKLVGFKAMAEHLPGEQVTAILNRYFAAAEDAVLANGGVVDKYIGTSLMALFGVPQAIEDAPKCAVNAALDLRDRIEELARDPSIPAPVTAQIGINSGLVIAGEIGGRVRRDFTVMGDTVNLAARFAEMCPSGAIYVGEATRAATPGAFVNEELPPVPVKGRAGASRLFRILARADSAARRPLRTASDRAGGTPLIGRRREVEHLRRDIGALAGGNGGATCLLGEAGLGKSRLLAEVLRDPSASKCTVLEAHASPVGGNLSFHPFVDLLRRWAGIREEHTEDEARAQLARALAGVDLSPDEAVPFLARLLGLRPVGDDEARLHTDDADALGRLIFKSVRDVIHAIASKRPLLFVFEDLHWADQTSLSLLGTLLRSCVERPIRFLLTSRPQPDREIEQLLATALGAHPEHHAELRLTPLEPAETVRLLESLLGTEDIPASLRRLIAEKSEGNPFFVEEVVRSLIDRGAIVDTGRGYRVEAGGEAVQIPGTVEEVVMSRVDRLEEPMRHLLQAAAVIGRGFSARVLVEILHRQGFSNDGMERDLQGLVDRHLLVEGRERATDAGVEYFFQHALTQQTIYESLLQKTRRELHRFVAEAIESVFRDRLDDYYGMLALHFSRADNPDKAEDYLFRAGEVASRSAATREALAFFQEASRLYLQRHGDGGDPFKKAVLENHVGIALLGRGQLTESIEHFDTALSHLGARAPESPLRLQLRFAGDLVTALARLYLRGGLGKGHVSASEQLLFHLVYNRTRALTTSDPQRLFIDNIGAIRRVTAVDARQVDEAFGIYVMAATLFGWSGRAYGIARRFARIAETLVDPQDIGDVFVSRFLGFGLAYLEGDWKADHLLDDTLVNRALQAGRFWDVQTYLGLACDRLLRCGEFAAAAQHLQRLAEIRDVYEYDFAGTNHDGMAAVLHLEARRLDEALASVDAYEKAIYEDPLRVLAFGTRAKVATLKGHEEEAAAALEAAEKTIERAQVIPPWHMSAYATSRLLFDVIAFEHDTRNRTLERRANRSARRAVALGKQVALPRAEAHRLAARFEWARNRPRRAIHHWEQALANAIALGAQPEFGRTLFEAGRRLDQAGHRQSVNDLSATECIERGQATLSRLGLAADAEHTRNTQQNV